MIGLVLSLLILVGILVYRLYSATKRESSETYLQMEVPGFVSHAKKVKVDLNDVEINSNVWTEDIVTDNSKYGGVNQIIGAGDKNISSVKHNWNVLSYKVMIDDRELLLEERVAMEPQTLQMKLMMQGETYLFINPENMSEYYLDLRFLQN